MPPTNTATIPQDLLPHEIAGPVDYLPYPLPVMLGAGVVSAIVLGLLVWALVAWLRRRRRRPLTAKEKALTALTAAHAEAEQVTPYFLSVEVCDILRHFLLEEHHIPATTQTSYEFLQSAQSLVSPSKLTRFLEKADAIKFAHAPATTIDNFELVDLATSIVKGEPDAVAA
jgi:hypothetical protein